MQSQATYKYARVSAQKVRLVADQIRGLPVDRALNILAFSNKKPASLIKKLLESVIANAENNDGMDVDELKVQSISVDEGPVLKRIRARAKGRAGKIIKRMSHIQVVVAD